MPTPDLDQAQQASAASIPALRAVIAGVLKDLDRALTTGRAAHVETALSGTRTLASACERLAEENERMRGEVARLRKAQPQPAPSKNYTLLGGTITPAPAGKGEG